MFEGRHVAMDDPRLTRVHVSFEHHLEAILNSAQKQGVAVVLSSLHAISKTAPFASSSPNHLESPAPELVGCLRSGYRTS